MRDAATHVKLTTLSPAIGDASIATLAFSPDGKMLAISGGTTLRLWHVSGRQQIRDPFISINNPDDYVTAAAFSADSRILAISTDHGAVQLWDIATDQEIGAPLISSPSDPISSLAFSPNGQIRMGPVRPRHRIREHLPRLASTAPPDATDRIARILTRLSVTREEQRKLVAVSGC